MQLRHKFSLMALVYLLSLTANVMLSCWCILVYFDSAFGEFEEALARQSVIEEVRNGLRRQGRALSEDSSLIERQRSYEESQRQIEADLLRLRTDEALPAHLREPIASAVSRKDAAAAPHLRPDLSVVFSESDRIAFQELDRLLGEASSLYRDQREQRLRLAALVQQRVILLLTVNGLIGAALCLAGLWALNRWIMQPVKDLSTATEEISQGRFGHRVQARAPDELGQLAHKINQMCATIVDMQKRLIEKERLAAAGEMVTRVAHNIRNPLSGIRVLSEATASRVSQDAQALDYQRRIIGSIDSFERWLRELQQSVAPLTLSPRRIDLKVMIERLAAGLHGMLLGRRISLKVEVSPGLRWVRVDPLHFEQAVAALLTNAVQASPPGECVILSAKPSESRACEWRLMIEDHGQGIAPELLDKIFSPYFTTKPDGTGLGLAIAQKVIRFHGGELMVESQIGRGSRFIAVVPGQLNEEADGGHSDH